MAAPIYEQKRDLFQRHFLLGKLEPGEIDTLATRARVASYRAGQEIFAKELAEGKVPPPAPR